MDHIDSKETGHTYKIETAELISPLTPSRLQKQHAEPSSQDTHCSSYTLLEFRLVQTPSKWTSKDTNASKNTNQIPCGMAINLTFEPYKHSFSKERIERKGRKVMRTSQQSELEE